MAPNERVMASTSRPPDSARLDRIVADARRARDARETTYRERALAIYPWICGRCAREFDRTNVSSSRSTTATTITTTIRPTAATGNCSASIATTTSTRASATSAGRGDSAGGDSAAPATHKPFAGLDALLKRKE